MMPFGPTLYLWRSIRGLRQEDLARRARVSRPNLCAVERGRREVTLTTLRALAHALEVTPGTLADGLPPLDLRSDRFPRERLERIARRALDRSGRIGEPDETVARHLARLIAGRRAARAAKPLVPRMRSREVQFSYLFLKACLPAGVLTVLVERVDDELARRPDSFED